MLVTVPDIGLHEVLASQALLLQLWPDAAHDVIALLQVLRLVPSLGDALMIGFIALVSAGPRSALALQCRRATVVAIGLAGDGAQVPEPCARLEQISRLEIRDVGVDGRSAVAALAARSAVTVSR